MGKSIKPRLTRRLQRQYRAILDGDGSQWWLWANQWCGNQWSAFHFAKDWHGRDIDLKRLARIVIRSGDAKCALRFAREVPGANVKRLQHVVLQHGTADIMRTFAREVPGANGGWLEATAVVQEVLGT